MSEVETDHESDRINNTGGTDNDLTTYGTISLFTSSLSNTPKNLKGVIPPKNSPQPSMLNKKKLSFHTGFILSLI
jgi:hypothetical protein